MANFDYSFVLCLWDGARFETWAPLDVFRKVGLYNHERLSYIAALWEVDEAGEGQEMISNDPLPPFKMYKKKQQLLRARLDKYASRGFAVTGPLPPLAWDSAHPPETWGGAGVVAREQPSRIPGVMRIPRQQSW